MKACRPMNDSHLLSTFSDSRRTPPPPGPPPSVRPAQVFDACQLGVVLRTVLFVEAVMAVGATLGPGNVPDWIERLAFLTGAALPGTLSWLIVACSLKQVLARLPPTGQHVFGVVLGMLAGLYGCFLLALVGIPIPMPWVGSALVGGMLAALVVAALVLRAKSRMPAETAARLAELQARIRPHFLFNSLNSAIALVREDPARAESLLEDLSELFRHALVDQGEAVTLSEEIAVARRYLAIEAVRFGDRLRLEWALDPLAGSARVPPLILQPLVENAVKHGVEPSSTGAEVKVSTQRRGGVVVIKVTNTVPSGQGRRGHGVAQGNVRDRLRLLHDVQGQFQTVLADGVYQVRIEIPA
jgi:two-component system, LytTR family, sensor histidine kinase AlgZ